MPSLQKYSYPFFAPPGRIPGPYLPITIENPLTKNNILWYCLIDSGADSCLFSGSVASILGHNLKGNGVRSQVTMGVEGQRVKTWLHTFSLWLMHPSRPDIAVWKSRKGLFECIEHDECPQLLGVDDFLRNFRVTLDYTAQKTTVQWKD